MALHTIRLREPWDRQADAEGVLQLQRRFNAPTGIGGGHRVFIAASGLAAPAVVFLNGGLLGRMDEEGKVYRWEVTAALRERNELRLAVEAPAGGGHDGGRELLVRLEIEDEATNG